MNSAQFRFVYVCFTTKHDQASGGSCHPSLFSLMTCRLSAAIHAPSFIALPERDAPHCNQLNQRVVFLREVISNETRSEFQPLTTYMGRYLGMDARQVARHCSVLMCEYLPATSSNTGLGLLTVIDKKSNVVYLGPGFTDFYGTKQRRAFLHLVVVLI
jgi:hypothetical protein